MWVCAHVHARDVLLATVCAVFVVVRSDSIQYVLTHAGCTQRRVPVTTALCMHESCWLPLLLGVCSEPFSEYGEIERLHGHASHL